jgi:hypothetical protein
MSLNHVVNNIVVPGSATPIPQTGTSAGYSNVTTVGGTTDYGPYPASYFLNGTGTVAAAGVIYTSADISNYNQLVVDVTAVTTSVDVYVSVDGTNFVGPVRLIDIKTGAVFATSALTAVGTYILNGKFKKIRIDGVGAGVATIRYSHGWV